MVKGEPVRICRDCLDRGGELSPRCGRCGSPRVVAHRELAALAVAHVDSDAFYASVEKRDDPSLADCPVVVGGGRRGVVLAACYVARTFGVRSAMPMFKALKACPHAVIVRPDMRKYASVGREIRAMMLALTPAVEPLSIDEAFLDLHGTELLHRGPPAATLARFQAEVERQVGVSVSVGLSHNKFLAKLASDLDKPRGFAVIGRADTRSVLAALPVSVIWGVGKAMQARLERDGFRLIGDLQAADPGLLAALYGDGGRRLARLAIGDDSRKVRASREGKTVSAETTFNHDLRTAEDILPHLRRLSERVSERLKAHEMRGRRVALKLKTADFRIRSRHRSLGEPTCLADRLYRIGRDLLLNELDGTAFRLVGIGLSGFGPHETTIGDLADPDADRRARAEAAMDAIRSRFGDGGVGLGLTFAARMTAARRDGDGVSSERPPPSARTPSPRQARPGA